MKKLGFTLAEVAIVLMVLGILTAVLLPMAFKSMPDENVMKFRKGNTTLNTTIRALVENDKYYKNGDLSLMPDGTVILGSFSTSGGATTTNENLIKYFCNTFADVVSTKSVNCSTAKTEENGNATFVTMPINRTESWHYTIEEGGAILDAKCKYFAPTVGSEIVTTDDITYYQTNPAGTFGVQWGSSALFKGLHSGLPANYKPFCMDIDGIPPEANSGYCHNECPFGYGIRYDGRIILGARAQEWMEKELTKGN